MMIQIPLSFTPGKTPDLGGAVWSYPSILSPDAMAALSVWPVAC